MKEVKTAKELEAMIEAGMTVTGSVAATSSSDGQNWTAIAKGSEPPTRRINKRSSSPQNFVKSTIWTRMASFDIGV
jgi:hypothetical protein